MKYEILESFIGLVISPIEEKPAKRIRCFTDKGYPNDPNVVWEAYEDGRIIYYADRCPDGEPSTFSIEDLESLSWLEEYEAWEAEE